MISKRYIDNKADLECYLKQTQSKVSRDAVIFAYRAMLILENSGYHVTTLTDGLDCIEQLCSVLNDVERHMGE